MNAFLFAERSKTARHESDHVAAEIHLGYIPSDIVITEPEGGGYVQGSCSGIAEHGPASVMFAVGCLDGHGSMDDEANLATYVPDPEEREKVLQVAAQIMATPQFAKVQKALRLKLQHTGATHPRPDRRDRGQGTRRSDGRAPCLGAIEERTRALTARRWGWTARARGYGRLDHADDVALRGVSVGGRTSPALIRT